MIRVLFSIWALLLGVVLIMLGNGMHFTLMGVRGGIEGFSAAQLAVVTSGYFVGFLSGARVTPMLIRRVGHVRTFAALGSFISAALIAFPILTDPWSWTGLRILIGFCMSGVYVTAESWLNDAATNETRGTVLSAYMLAQTLGIIGAQALLTLGDPATSTLFIAASILVSVSFSPILLSVGPVPAAAEVRPMGLLRLFQTSPLGTVGIFLLGAAYATQTGMSAVFGAQIGLTVDQIALFVATLFAGALVMQYPIGWLSDRYDRRRVILGAAAIGALACVAGFLTGGVFSAMALAAFFAGGVTTPLYSLFLAYTNDYLEPEDMAAASGGLVFTFGLGAIVGPLTAGWAMERFGPYGFWPALGAYFAAITVYALIRMTQRPPTPVDETESYVGLLPTASPMAAEAAGVWAVDNAEAEAEAEAETGEATDDARADA